MQINFIVIVIFLFNCFYLYKCCLVDWVEDSSLHHPDLRSSADPLRGRTDPHGDDPSGLLPAGKLYGNHGPRPNQTNVVTTIRTLEGRIQRDSEQRSDYTNRT